MRETWKPNSWFGSIFLLNTGWFSDFSPLPPVEYDGRPLKKQITLQQTKMAIECNRTHPKKLVQCTTMYLHSWPFVDSYIILLEDISLGWNWPSSLRISWINHIMPGFGCFAPSVLIQWLMFQMRSIPNWTMSCKKHKCNEKPLELSDICFNFVFDKWELLVPVVSGPSLFGIPDSRK